MMARDMFIAAIKPQNFESARYAESRLLGLGLAAYLGLLVIFGCDPGCACSCYIKIYNNFYKGGIFTYELFLMGYFLSVFPLWI